LGQFVRDAEGRLLWSDQDRCFRSEQVGSLDELLRRPLEEVRRLTASASMETARPVRQAKPVESQEVWAAGVTYQRSREARMEEAASPDPYDRVYAAERPELFFKASADRVSGPGEAILIRGDSTWDVPEPELAVVCNSALEVVGYTIGNDVSSRSIEGENPLYLPQAKVYVGSCALGPGIVPAWEYDPRDQRVQLEIHRDRQVVYSGETRTSQMRRSIGDLIRYLGRHNRFPAGVILLTGTGVVPPDTFTLQPRDEVVVRIEGIGELRNPVERA
jgi:2-dehydro-3-deoxy-D-arabinonate dehydratase